MLRLTIIFSAILFASELIADQSDDVLESWEYMYLHQIYNSLLEIAARVYNASSIPERLLSNLNEEMLYHRLFANFALNKLKSKIKYFEMTHERQNISDCVDLYNVQADNVKFTLGNISSCSAIKIQMYYIQNMYHDIKREINHCKGNIDRNHNDPSILIIKCYYDASYEVATLLRTSDIDEKKLKINKPDQLYIEQIFADCKTANRLENIKLGMLNITDSARECINYAKRNDTLLEQIGDFTITVRDFLCDGLLNPFC